MKLPPASANRSKIRRLSSSEAPHPQSSPNVMVPSASSETRSPVGPSSLYLIPPSSSPVLDQAASQRTSVRPQLESQLGSEIARDATGAGRTTWPPSVEALASSARRARSARRRRSAIRARPSSKPRSTMYMFHTSPLVDTSLRFARTTVFLRAEIGGQHRGHLGEDVSPHAVPMLLVRGHPDQPGRPQDRQMVMGGRLRQAEPICQFLQRGAGSRQLAEHPESLLVAERLVQADQSPRGFGLAGSQALVRYG